MQGRRRDEPFNPFAPGARNKRKAQRDRTGPKPGARSPEKTGKTQNPADISQLRKRALEEMKKSTSEKSDNSNSEVSGTTTRKEERPRKAQESREDRLAELRRKSAASVKVAEEVKKSAEEEAVEEKQPVIEVVAEPELIEEPLPLEVEESILDNEAVIDTGAANVFKQVKTVVAKPQGGKKRRRRDDVRGGGRQPKMKKLDRRKYLEYKYTVRDMLDDDRIPEEHRSNLLGQIWAKGERIGVDDSVAFIDQKVLENIIPESIAEELRRLVKQYTTKR